MTIYTPRRVCHLLLTPEGLISLSWLVSYSRRHPTRSDLNIFPQAFPSDPTPPSAYNTLTTQPDASESDSTHVLPANGLPPQAEAPPVGVIVCKQDMHKSRVNRGYIAMLSVDKAWRKRGIGVHVWISVMLWRRAAWINAAHSGI